MYAKTLFVSTEKENKMRPRKESNRRSRSRPSSPIKDRTMVPPMDEQRSPRSQNSNPRVSLLDRDMVTEDITLFEELSVSRDITSSNQNPRSFPYSVKQQCWDKAEKIKGRDPDRWRRDALGNIVFRKLVGCAGCLCHDYDHIVPYSKVVE